MTLEIARLHTAELSYSKIVADGNILNTINKVFPMYLNIGEIYIVFHKE